MKMAILGKCLWMVTGILLLHVPAGITETFLLEKAFKTESPSKPNTATKPCPSVPHPPIINDPEEMWMTGNSMIKTQKVWAEKAEWEEWGSCGEQGWIHNVPCRVGAREAVRSCAGIGLRVLLSRGRQEQNRLLSVGSSSVGWQLQGVRQQRSQMGSGADSTTIRTSPPQKGRSGWEGCSGSAPSHTNPALEPPPERLLPAVQSQLCCPNPSYWKNVWLSVRICLTTTGFCLMKVSKLSACSFPAGLQTHTAMVQGVINYLEYSAIQSHLTQETTLQSLSLGPIKT